MVDVDVCIEVAQSEPGALLLSKRLLFGGGRSNKELLIDLIEPVVGEIVALLWQWRRGLLIERLGMERSRQRPARWRTPRGRPS